MSYEPRKLTLRETSTLINHVDAADEVSVIHDLRSLDLGLLLQLDPIPPILIELVTLMAVIAADEDWKIYTETGKHPTLDIRGRGSK